MFFKYKSKGFTLLEILLVVAIIAILAGIVIVAINPAKQLGSTRDAERKSDINTLYKAVNQYLIDKGTPPLTITTTLTPICDPNQSCSGINLSILVPTYLSSIPTDPLATTDTGYAIAKVNGNVFVVALLTEQGFTTQPGYSSSTPVVAFVGKLPSNYTPPVATGATSTGGGPQTVGTVWTDTGYGGAWNAISCTGTNCIVGDNSGHIWHSSDSGITWTDVGYNGNWSAMACTGTNCIAGSHDGDVWYSTQ